MSKLKRTAIKIVWQVLPAPTHAPHSTRSYDFYVSSGFNREFSVALRLTCNATSPYINVRVPKACSLHEPASPKSVCNKVQRTYNMLHRSINVLYLISVISTTRFVFTIRITNSIFCDDTTKCA